MMHEGPKTSSGKWDWLRIQLEIFGRIRLHPLFLGLMVIAIGVGMWQTVAVLFILVILHEIGHATVARALGHQVEEVSIYPFGGVAKLSYGHVGVSPQHEALIAIAGPFVNLVLSLLSFVFNAIGLWSPSFTHQVLQMNLWIVVFNLLPGLPLDGGRILRAARSRKVGYDLATQEAYNVAIAISIVLLVVGALALWGGSPHLGMIILGVFLFITALSGRRDASMETVRFLDAKRHRKRRTAERIQAIAAPQTATIREVVKQFSPDRYHMVYVLDSDGSVRTILEEDELLDAVFEGKWTEPLGVFC